MRQPESSIYVTWEGRELELRGKFVAAERDVGLQAGFEPSQVLNENGTDAGLTEEELDRLLESQELGDVVAEQMAGDPDDDWRDDNG